MTQHVRSEMDSEASRLGSPSQYQPYTLCTHAGPTRVHEETPVDWMELMPPCQVLLDTRDIFIDCQQRKAFTATFPVHQDDAISTDEILAVESAEFRHTETGCGQQADHRVVAARNHN